MLTGFVLAGGASSRMGRDKALLGYGGEALAARTHRILCEGGCEPVYLVGNQSGLTELALPLIREREGEHHPARGIVAALGRCSGEMGLIAPCDLPGLMPEDIRRLIDFGSPCVARAGGRLQPLLAVLPVALVGAARTLLTSGGPIRALVEGLPPVDVDIRVSWNANTPTDL